MPKFNMRVGFGEAKSFKLFLRCLMKKLASLFALIPLSLLKRLSLLCHSPPTHTHNSGT